MEASLAQCFTKFRQNIIMEANDTKQVIWENCIIQLAERAELLKFNYVDPQKFMKFPDPDSNVLNRLDSLENACYCLSQYALNLCRNPAAKDFDLLKTYTGYYAVNIQAVMEDNDREVLEKMGYQVRDNCENDDEFVLNKRGQRIDYLAFELFLCQAYYRRMKFLCQQALSLKFERKIIISMFNQYSLHDITGFGVQELCQKLVEESRPETVKPMEVNDNNYEFLDPYASSGDLGTQRNHQPNHQAVHHGETKTLDGQSYPATGRLVDYEGEPDDDDLYGDVDAGESTGSHPPALVVKKPPTPPPGFEKVPASRTNRTDVYDNDYLRNQIKLPGDVRSHSVSNGSGSDSFAQRAGASMNRMQRQSSLTEKKQIVTTLDRSEDSSIKSTVVTGKPFSEHVSANSIRNRPTDTPDDVFYRSSNDNEGLSAGMRPSLKERSRNTDPTSAIESSLKRTQISSHAAASDYDTYMHLDANAKQPNSPQLNIGRGGRSLQSSSPQLNIGSRSSPGYEDVLSHGTTRGSSRPQGNQSIPNLYSTDAHSSPTSRH